LNFRDLSPELQALMDSGVSTLTVLLKVVPRDPNFAAFGITKLDRDIVYDDGDGEVLYSASVGMVTADLVSSEAMDVGNSEFKHLIPQFSIPISEEYIRAGVYDWANYYLRIVNYEDLTMGHWEPPSGWGQTGRVTVDDRGLSFQMELTDMTKLLKQTIVEKDSITCRAKYGSQPIGTSDSSGIVIEQRFPCGATLTWAGPKTVTSVSPEPNLTFTASSLGAAEGAYVPGMVHWLSGRNAGRQSPVSDQTGSGVITLYAKVAFPVEVGDTFEIRHDCTKWIYGTHGCKENFGGGDEWKLHYRGEPFIPISDADSINTPGATVGAGS
jgi:uncharacterized phage protein (TIGR02218 family)